MSLREAAERIGIAGAGREPARKLWRLLRATERDTGRAAAIRFGTRIYVTEASLRSAFPQMFDRRLEVERELREDLARLHSTIAEARAQIRAMAAKVRETRTEIAVLAETCSASSASLERRLRRLEVHSR